jgi:hypothetical protein
MPEVLDRCVKKLMSQGYSKDKAFAICVKSTGWKRGKGGRWVKAKKEESKMICLWASPFDSNLDIKEWMESNFPDVKLEIDDELISESFHDDVDIWYHVVVSEIFDENVFLDRLAKDFAVIQEKVPEKVLAWRRRQKPGKIMKPSTFKEIERKAREAGYDDPKAVAGAAYWRTVKAKYSKAKKKSGKE